MTNSHSSSSTSPDSAQWIVEAPKPQRRIARLRRAAQLFVDRSHLGPVNNYCAGDRAVA